MRQKRETGRRIESVKMESMIDRQGDRNVERKQGTKQDSWERREGWYLSGPMI